MRENDFSPQGLKYLRRAALVLGTLNGLPVQKLREDTLQELELQHLSDAEAYLLAVALPRAKSCRSVRLWPNTFTLRGGVKALGDALRDVITAGPTSATHAR